MIHRGYQVATSSSAHTPYRKWLCLGAFYAPSHKSAAYMARNYSSVIVAEFQDGTFEFQDGIFVRVDFGLSS